MTLSTSPLRAIKMALVSGLVILGLVAAYSSSYSQTPKPDKSKATQAATTSSKAEDYVGAETCKMCHEEAFNNFQKTTHFKLTRFSSYAAADKGCESCHGAGKAHVDGSGDKTKIRTFQGESAKQISEACLRCHAGKEEHNNYRRGEHWRNDISCVNCHAPHAAKATPKMLVDKEPALCYTCHNEIKAQFSAPFHHKVPEGAMKCSDCHNPHGGFETKQARTWNGNSQGCVKCHADKQGPFVFEHAVIRTDGCTACHDQHGSNNPKLLKRNQVRVLCLECHTAVGGTAPNSPSSHNQATTQYQNCTTCHIKIHGSNLNRTFFR
jgi:DmsE family decaheme c-type cytochrome